ncbi:MAG: hypothetical protein ACK4SS_09300, partial [Cypionkella sp.]
MAITPMTPRLKVRPKIGTPRPAFMVAAGGRAGRHGLRANRAAELLHLHWVGRITPCYAQRPEPMFCCSPKRDNANKTLHKITTYLGRLCAAKYFSAQPMVYPLISALQKVLEMLHCSMYKNQARP